jgi:hypothetical protein
MRQLNVHLARRKRTVRRRYWPKYVELHFLIGLNMWNCIFLDFLDEETERPFLLVAHFKEKGGIFLFL